MKTLKNKRFTSKGYDSVHSDIFDYGEEIATVYNEDAKRLLELLNGLDTKVKRLEKELSFKKKRKPFETFYNGKTADEHYITILQKELESTKEKHQEHIENLEKLIEHLITQINKLQKEQDEDFKERQDLERELFIYKELIKTLEETNIIGIDIPVVEVVEDDKKARKE